MNRATGVALLGTAILALAGCGGDGGPGASITKAQYIAKASAVCLATKRAQGPINRKLAALPDRTDIKRVAPLAEDALAESRQGLAKLRALPVPSQDSDRLDAYLAAADRLLAAHKDLADAARASDRPAGAKVARETQALSDDERRTAADYGLRDCEDVF
jgi:hypothetical protein